MTFLCWCTTSCSNRSAHLRKMPRAIFPALIWKKSEWIASGLTALLRRSSGTGEKRTAEGKGIALMSHPGEGPKCACENRNMNASPTHYTTNLARSFSCLESKMRRWNPLQLDPDKFYSTSCRRSSPKREGSDRSGVEYSHVSANISTSLIALTTSS